MKYLVLLGDGMADYPVQELDGLTPLQKAHKPNMDRLAQNAEIGLVKTVPDHLDPPGSDIANMSVLGYDPDVYYTGRSPLEAVSMGVELDDDDIAVRCNLVTLSGSREHQDSEYEDSVMTDYSSDEITTKESSELIRYIDEKLGTPDIRFYPGISYRHCVVLKHVPDAEADMHFTPPHDITGRCIRRYMPEGRNVGRLTDIMKKSRELLKDHPVNRERVKKGLRPATSVWLWGQGRRPSFDSFEKRYDVKGAVISAVDLVKGLGICAGLYVPDIEGATGNIDTDYEGKADAAIEFYRKGGDFVYLHVEAPDECGHRHEIQNKVRSIENIDERILGRILAYFKESGEDHRILVMPDHPTPLSIMTHTHDPVPYMIYDSTKPFAGGNKGYDEQCAAASGIYEPMGHRLMRHFIGE